MQFAHISRNLMRGLDEISQKVNGSHVFLSRCPFSRTTVCFILLFIFCTVDHKPNVPVTVKKGKGLLWHQGLHWNSVVLPWHVTYSFSGIQSRACREFSEVMDMSSSGVIPCGSH